MTDDMPDIDQEPSSQDRAQSALALKIAGASNAQVAKMLDFPDAESARLAMEKAIASTVTEEDRERHRLVLSMKLEKLWFGVYPKARNPKHPEHLAAARLALSILDREAKLHGADAPQKIEVSNPAREELEAWVSSMMALKAKQFPQEADIIDADEVEP